MFKIIFILILLYLIYVVVYRKIVPAMVGHQFLKGGMWAIVFVMIATIGAWTAVPAKHSSTSSEARSSQSSSYSSSSSSEEESDSSSSESSISDTETSSSSASSQQETIIANSKTKVYHTPGQHNYHINPANTVYFNSEAEAQANGYRPSQR